MNFKDLTTWWRVTLWRKKAESAGQYLSKGKQVYIEGRVTLREYQDRDGNTRTTLEVQATDMKFIGSKDVDGAGDRTQPAPRGEQSRTKAANAPVTEDDISF